MNRLSNSFTERFKRHESWWVLLLFVLLTTIAAWNIVTDLNGVIISNDNDTYINPWADWWTYKAITDPEILFWHTEMMYYPVGANLLFHSFSHLNTAVSLILRPWLGDLPAYNLAVLLNYILAGLSMYQLAKYQTKSTTASVLAGIVFAFNSQNLYQSTHPDFVSVWCFPWITLFFIRAVRENSIKLAITAALFVFLGAATSTVLVILMIFWLAILVIYMYVATEFPKPPLRILVTFVALSGLLILPLVWPLLIGAVSSGNDSFVIDPNDSIKTDIFSIFVPHWYGWLIRSMYLGIVPFYLAIVAFGRKRKPARLWFILAASAFLFAIGPIPEFAGFDLKITLPWTLPIAPILRNMYRMMIIFTMGWAMIVAYGWLGFREQLQKKTAYIFPIFLLVGAGIFLEYTAVPFPATPNIVSTFYTDYLDDIPNDVALAILPTSRQTDKRYMYYQTFHEHPMTGGMIARGDNTVYKFIEENPLLRAGATDLEPIPLPANPEKALQQLADANIGYLIIDKTMANDAEVWRDYLPIDPIFEDDLVIVYSTGLLIEPSNTP